MNPISAVFDSGLTAGGLGRLYVADGVSFLRGGQRGGVALMGIRGAPRTQDWISGPCGRSCFDSAADGDWTGSDLYIRALSL